MANLTVYRQQEPPFSMTMANCLAAAATQEDTDLIALSMRTKRPALVGLDSRSSIILPGGELDGRITFEDLYDTCLTLVDLQHMREANVSNPEDVPLRAYRLEVLFAIDGTCQIPIALLASSIGDARPRLRTLIAKDVMFREALFDAVIQAIDRNFRAEEDIVFRVRESSMDDRSIIPPLLPGAGPEWRILE
jgi:hypothetical protein